MYQVKEDGAVAAPWIDFDADTVYVGDNTGIMYKITGVFMARPRWPAAHGRSQSAPASTSALRSWIRLWDGWWWVVKTGIYLRSRLGQAL